MPSYDYSGAAQTNLLTVFRSSLTHKRDIFTEHHHTAFEITMVLSGSGIYSTKTGDFSFEKDGRRCFLEVKGVTLETDGVCAFPDAPTERGVKHLKGLCKAATEGYGAYVLFVIQMADVKYLHPNDTTDPAFGQALRQAAAAGVKVMALDCAVTPDTMHLRCPVLVKL